MDTILYTCKNVFIYLFNLFNSLTATELTNAKNDASTNMNSYGYIFQDT